MASEKHINKSPFMFYGTENLCVGVWFFALTLFVFLRADAHAEGTWKSHLDSKREVKVFAR